MAANAVITAARAHSTSDPSCLLFRELLPPIELKARSLALQRYHQLASVDADHHLLIYIQSTVLAILTHLRSIAEIKPTRLNINIYLD